MNLGQAKKITGGLSSPGKLNCRAFSVPATSCKNGSKLREKEGSICSKCYAQKGFYVLQWIQVIRQQTF